VNGAPGFRDRSVTAKARRAGTQRVVMPLTTGNGEPGMGVEPTTFALQAPLPPFRAVGLRSLQWRSPAGMTLRRSGRWGLVGRRCDAFVSFS